MGRAMYSTQLLLHFPQLRCLTGDWQCSGNTSGAESCSAKLNLVQVWSVPNPYKWCLLGPLIFWQDPMRPSFHTLSLYPSPLLLLFLSFQYCPWAHPHRPFALAVSLAPPGGLLAIFPPTLGQNSMSLSLRGLPPCWICSSSFPVPTPCY